MNLAQLKGPILSVVVIVTITSILTILIFSQISPPNSSNTNSLNSIDASQLQLDTQTLELHNYNPPNKSFVLQHPQSWQIRAAEKSSNNLEFGNILDSIIISSTNASDNGNITLHITSMNQVGSNEIDQILGCQIPIIECTTINYKNLDFSAVTDPSLTGESQPVMIAKARSKYIFIVISGVTQIEQIPPIVHTIIDTIMLAGN